MNVHNCHVIILSRLQKVIANGPQ